MNDKDKEAFEKWWDNLYSNQMEWRDWQGCDIVFNGKEDMRCGWQAACEYKQKEIDELEESLVVRLSKSYIAGKDLSKIIQKNLTNEIEKL